MVLGGHSRTAGGLSPVERIYTPLHASLVRDKLLHSH